jgi:hypothetical protein
MRSGAVALVTGHVEADRIMNVILDRILLPDAGRLTVNLGLRGFGPQVPRFRG